VADVEEAGTRWEMERRMRTAQAPVLLVFVALLGTTGCGGGETARDGAGTEEIMSGPVDGHDLPGTDLERVQDGEPAPDFSLESYAGPVVTLSDFRGEKNVVLVFYRGHW
jgi:hypothetical protein